MARTSTGEVKETKYGTQGLENTPGQKKDKNTVITKGEEIKNNQKRFRYQKSIPGMKCSLKA